MLYRSLDRAYGFFDVGFPHVVNQKHPLIIKSETKLLSNLPPCIVAFYIEILIFGLRVGKRGRGGCLRSSISSGLTLGF